jgi:hypothetical protein
MLQPSNQSLITHGLFVCSSVILLDSQFEVIDRVRVNFTTWATNKTKGAQGGTSPPSGAIINGGGRHPDGSGVTCQELCPNLYV